MAKDKKKPKSSDGDGILLIATNRRATFDYHVIEAFECGMQLLGTEVKSLRQNHCQLQGSYGRVEDDTYTVWLVSANIPEYKAAGEFFQHEPQRKRKLLLHKREINRMRKLLHESGTTLIPLKMYFKGGRAKCVLGVCRGKRHYDKREDKKKKDIDKRLRSIARG